MTRFRRGTTRRAWAATATLAVLLLGGCATATPPSGSGGGSAGGDGGGTGVAVDTPALRAAKQKAGIEDCPATHGAAATQGLPSVTLPCLGGGRSVDLAALRGPVVVNLWAQWCGPCRQELPYYQELHKRAGDRVRVLGIDYQDTRPDWAIELMRETGVTYPSLADPDGNLRVPLKVRGLPGILFVDAQGRVVHQEFAVIESYQQLAGLVKQHLGVAVGTPG